MSRIDSGWKYYVPEHGETKDDARPVMKHEWQKYMDAELAAEIASEEDWDNGGYESGIGSGPDIVVISPDGNETKFSTYREYEVRHSVFEKD